jgi:hypothetical protein
METTNTEEQQRHGWTLMVVHLGEYLATVQGGGPLAQGARA